MKYPFVFTAKAFQEDLRTLRDICERYLTVFMMQDKQTQGLLSAVADFMFYDLELIMPQMYLPSFLELTMIIDLILFIHKKDPQIKS